MRSKSCLYYIIFFIIAAGSIFAEEPVNYLSGIYNENIFLNVNDLSNDRKITYSFNKDEPAIPFQEGLLLSALPGEERTYNISFKIDNDLYSYSYKIDRKKPAKPKAVLQIDDGAGYVFPDFLSGDDKIYYGLDDYKQGELFLWEGEPIPVQNTGLIFYFAKDAAGNESPVSFILPEESAAATGRANLQVKSPVEGDFANPQLLYIEKKGFEWIKYTLNGSDPASSGALYTEPVEIRRYGNVILKITAKPLNSNNIINREINYRVNTKAPLKNIPPSGIYSSVINIESRLSGYRYCLEERSPGTDDPYFDGELNINPVYGGVKYTVVRITNPVEDELGDFRYYYIIDDRFPANPVIKYSSNLPDENIINVNIEGPVYSDIFYTLDGSNPGKSSDQYTGSFSIKIPENKNAGSIIVKARAISLNGKPSNAVSKIFAFDTKKPDTPEVSVILDKDTGLYSLNYELNNDEQLIYYVSNDEPTSSVSFSDFSPINRTEFFLDVPVGSEMDFNFIFAVIDSAGNKSDFSKAVKVSINKKIPSFPNVLYENSILTIESDNHVRYKYEIIKNGNIISSETNNYTTAIDLNDIVLSGSTILLNLEISDDFGNILNTKDVIYQPEETVAKETVLFSRKAEDIYSGTEVAFYAYPDGIDDRLYYNLTEYNLDGTQTTTGPFETDGYISISGDENIKKDYFLEIYSINEDTKKKSEINTYEFTIDNELPRIPEISGIRNGSVVGDRVILKADSDEDSVVFLNYSSDPEGLGELFSNSSIIFNKSLTFDVKPGIQQDFYLKLGAGDSAGNFVVNDEVFHFIIDRKLPVISKVEYKDSLSGSNMFYINVEGEEGIKYFYEYGLCGTTINSPSKDSDFFTEELELDGEAGTDGSYIIKILAVDAVGNEATHPLSFMYLIDNTSPAPPDEPEILINNKNKKAMLFWDDIDEGIVYRVVFDDASDVQWNDYKKPISLKYNSENKKLLVEYYSVDMAGNRSEINEKIIRLPTSENTNLVMGINNNSFYNTNLELRAVDDKRIIRYEISTDQIVPSTVSIFSPVLPKVLPFRIEEGESINFVVSLKEFFDEGDDEGGAEQVLRFSIDKQVPEPPEIEGITDGEYYLSDCTAYFKAGGDSIFYSIDDGTGREDLFVKYEEAFDIASPEGSYRSYKIKAYSKDNSGNKSAVKSFEITIDKEIIYVSKNGKDYFEGTRSKPYASLNKALEQVKHSDRKTIFIEEGIYELNSPGIIDESVTIYGGFRSGSWQDKTAVTEILINKSFPEDNPAFYIYGGNLTVENLFIKSGTELNNAVFYVNKGILNIRNSKIFCENGKNASFLKQNYGKLIINNTNMNGTISDIPFIFNDYGVVSINNSNFDIYAGSSGGTILKAENCSEYSINSSEITVTGGQNIQALSFTNSDLRLKSNIIIIKNADVSATALESVNSRIDMTYCKVVGEGNNRITRAFVSEDSKLDFNGNSFRLDAIAGVIGFSLTGGTSIFSNNNLSTDKCNDFTYLFLLNGGKHDIETNIIDIDSADEIINVRTKDSELDFLNNTLRVRGGKNNTIIFKPETDSVNRIINNIFINEEASSVTTIMHDSSENSMLSFKNNCSWGWDSYLMGNIEADTLISLDLVDGIYSGGRFSANIEEDPANTFVDGTLYKIAEESKCIDSGYDLTNIINNKTDFDGEQRPNKSLNPRAVFDIGADEYYQ